MEQVKNYHKIGQVAEMIQVSVPTLRMYEREGILIPVKSRGGTRYFNDEDVHWIRCIRRMITGLGLNIEGIRRLLALIPCGEIISCDQFREGRCQEMNDGSKPCWMKNSSCKELIADCHDCPAYRYSINCENLKGLFHIRLRQIEAEDRLQEVNCL